MRRSVALVTAAALALLGAAPVGAAAAPDEPPAPAAAGTRFVPMTPTRVLDTRSGIGRPGTTPVGAGGTVTVALADKVPAHAKAVVLNVTGTETSAATYVSVYPSGVPRPAASTLNLVKGETRPNATTVMLGADGAVTLFNFNGSVHLLADLAGYYTESATLPEGVQPGAFTAISPTRVLDTRTGAKVGPGGVITLDLSTRVPASATAVTFNLTGVEATTNTFVTAWPTGAPRPTASSLNLTPAVPTPNHVTVALGQGRKVDLYNFTGSVHLIADLAGHYATDGGKLFYPALPKRVVDTRATGTTLVAGSGFEHFETDTPDDVSAFAANVTGVAPTASTFITVWPAGTPRPNASVLNLVPGQVSANMTTAGLGPLPGYPYRGFAVYNQAGQVDVVIDLFGHFAD